MSDVAAMQAEPTAAKPDDAGAAAAAAGRRAVFVRLGRLAPILLLYLVGVVLPYLSLFRMSFNRYDPMMIFREMISAENYVKILTDAFYLEVIVETLAMGVGIVLCTLVIGYPLAWKIARATPFVKSTLLAAVLSPLLINLVVRTYAWLVVLGDRGVINEQLAAFGLSLPLMDNWFAVVVGLTHVTLPFMVLSLVAVMESVRNELLEASEILGAGPVETFLRVVWPLTWPGVGSGSILVFSFSISAFVTPALLGGGHVATVSTLIYEQFTYALNWPLGSAMVFILLAMNMGVLVLHGALFSNEEQ